MKRIIIILTALIFGFTANSQNGVAKIEQLKKDFITQELSLTPQESEAFFPLYNEYMAKKRMARKSLKNELNASESAGSLDNIMDKEQDIVNIQKEYMEKFRDVLPEAKVIKLIEAEKKFKSMLIQRLKK